MSVERFKCTKELLEKVKNGDSETTVLLYKKIKEIAYKKAYSILNNHYDAEDVAEDSFIKTIEKIDTIKKPSEFSAWINRIAENKAKDLIKKNKPIYMDDSFEYSTDDTDGDQSVLPENVIELKENIDLYKQLIEKLTEPQRTVLVLHRIEGKKFKEIAEILGCSENTVKSRSRLGEKKLEKEAAKLKKKGYTLNGMLPLEFFIYMSNTLGVATYNIASVLGVTTTNVLSLKAMVSIVTAILIAFGGLLCTNLIYGDIKFQQFPITNYKSDGIATTVSSQVSSNNQSNINQTLSTSETISKPEKETTTMPFTVDKRQNIIPVSVVSLYITTYYLSKCVLYKYCLSKCNFTFFINNYFNNNNNSYHILWINRRRNIIYKIASYLC